MLTKYPKYSALLNSYAYFSELIMRNAEEAAKYHRRADEQKAREAEEAKNNDGSGSIDSQAVVAVAEDGMIEQVNKTLLKLFGFSRQEVMGRNIRILVPSPWKEKHDNFLLRYRQTNNPKVIGRPQT
jgi:PAS domain-containing protein